jgi:hypothetical protein
MTPPSHKIQFLLEPTCDLVSVKRNHVTVKMRATDIPIAVRAAQLLDAEKLLREKIDPRIEIFLEPRADRNTVRVNLRGVKL